MDGSLKAELKQTMVEGVFGVHAASLYEVGPQRYEVWLKLKFPLSLFRCVRDHAAGRATRLLLDKAPTYVSFEVYA